MTRILDLNDIDNGNTLPVSPNSDDISKKFPFKEFRPGQFKAISMIKDWLLNKDQKFFLLEAPTGSGKSVMGYTIAQFFNDAYYLTSTKVLQDQMMRDFSFDGKTIDLKGRNAYPCIYWDIKNEWVSKGKPLPVEDVAPIPKPAKWLGCDEGVCKTRDKRAQATICAVDDGKLSCPYFERVLKTQKAHLAIMNFKSFLFQTTVVKRFLPRRLLIIDEAHNCESQLLDFVGISISDAGFAPLKFPKLNSVAEYIKFFIDNNILDDVRSKAKLARLSQKDDDAEEWESLAFKIEKVILEPNLDNWVCQYKETKNGAAHIIELKPIFIDSYAHQYLFNFADKIILMSATILDANEICKSLGIPKSQVKAYQMKCRFPVENRQIVLKNSGSLSYKNKNDTYPILIKDINAICKQHSEERGIIHTHNFEIAKLILNECDKSLLKRFKFQFDYRTKDEMLEAHAKDKNSIIVAPAMHEGIDLKDDLARFQIIAKVPYPSLKDNPQLEARMKVSPSYYDLLTSLKLVQSYGRAVRSEEDWAITYIMDSDIQWFIKKAEKVIPTWFKEAIKQ